MKDFKLFRVFRAWLVMGFISISFLFGSHAMFLAGAVGKEHVEFEGLSDNIGTSVSEHSDSVRLLSISWVLQK